MSYSNVAVFDQPPPFGEAFAEVEAAPQCTEEYMPPLIDPIPFSQGPRIVSRCAPQFPDLLQRAGITGACLALVDADADGAAQN
ncbi:MAG: hypothetical protein PVI23_12480, partial [Maricaulaceae bacterium]